MSATAEGVGVNGGGCLEGELSAASAVFRFLLFGVAGGTGGGGMSVELDFLLFAFLVEAVAPDVEEPLTSGFAELAFRFLLLGAAPSVLRVGDADCAGLEAWTALRRADRLDDAIESRKYRDENRRKWPMCS